MKQGPNVKKLIATVINNIISNGNTIAVLSSPSRLIIISKEATEWVKTVIAVVKAASDNPFGEDDEAIAGEILKGIAERKQVQTNRSALA